MSDTPAPAPVAPRRRFSAGCIMLLVGAVWLGVLGGWMVYSLYRQLQEIRTFADTAAKPVVPVQPAAEEITALRGRLAAFAQSVEKKEKASLRLSVADLNTLLATEEPLRGMKEGARVEEITESAVRLSISLGMNGVPFSGERFWLNGGAEVVPSVHKDKGILISTRSLTVPGRTVTEGFLHHYKEHGHLDTLLMDPWRPENSTVLPVLKKLTTVRMEPGAVTVEFAP